MNLKPDQCGYFDPISWFIDSSTLSGRYQSGQMGQTVNLLAQPSEVRILLSPQTGGELTT